MLRKTLIAVAIFAVIIFVFRMASNKIIDQIHTLSETAGD